MADYRRHEILSGVFILLAVLVFALFAFKVGQFDIFRIFKGRVLECRAYFQDVKSLEKGAKVVVGGQEVGRVTAIALAEGSDLKDRNGDGRVEGVEVFFEIDNMDLRLGGKPVVRLDTDGFLGAHFLKLSPGWQPDEVPQPIADRIDSFEQPYLITQETGGDIDTLIEQSGPLMDQVQAMLADLQTVVATVKDEVITSDDKKGVLLLLGKLNATMDKADSFVQRLNDLTNEQREDSIYAYVLRPTRKLLDDLDGEVLKISKTVQEVTLPKLHKLIDGGSGFVANADSALAEARNMLKTANPKVQRSLDKLEAAIGDGQKLLANLKKDIGQLSGEINGMVAENRPDIRETIRRIRRTAWQFEMAVRKIRANPAYLIFGDDGKDLEAMSVDEDRVRRSGRAKPYGQRDEGDK